MKSRQYKTGHFPAPAICTRALQRIRHFRETGRPPFESERVLAAYQLVTFKEVKPLEDQLPSLPGGFYKDDANRITSGTGLRTVKPFIPTNEPISAKYHSAERETYPEPSNDYLADLLGRRYAKDDVAGYGGRVRELEDVFRHLSKGKAIGLYLRLVARVSGDKISMSFHDHLSTITRTKMLAIVRSRM